MSFPLPPIKATYVIEQWTAITLQRYSKVPVTPERISRMSVFNFGDDKGDFGRATAL